MSSASAALLGPQITVGPLSASNGFKVTINAACVRRASADVIVSKAGHHYALSYTYFPGVKGYKASCSVSRRMGSGSLSLRWGRVMRADLKFAATGPRRRLTPKGCTGSFGHTRNVEGTGTLKLGIHTRVFGKLTSHTVPAQFQVNSLRVRGHCPTTNPSTDFVNLTSGWWPHGNRWLDASMAPSGQRSVHVSLLNNLGKLTQDVEDRFTGSRKLFSFATNLSSARIGSPGPFLSGSLRYSATSPCTFGSTSPADFNFGQLRGRLVVHDPVLGPVTFLGARAQEPGISRGGNSCAVS